MQWSLLLVLTGCLVSSPSAMHVQSVFHLSRTIYRDLLTQSTRPIWKPWWIWLKKVGVTKSSEVLYCTSTHSVLTPSVIKKRKESKDDIDDLLGLMLQGKDPVTGQGMTDESIAQNLVVFMIAGHETTSGLLAFTVSVRWTVFNLSFKCLLGLSPSGTSPCLCTSSCRSRPSLRGRTYSARSSWQIPVSYRCFTRDFALYSSHCRYYDGLSNRSNCH